MKPGHIDPNADLEFFTLDDLREEHDRLSDRLAAVERRIEAIESGENEWMSYRDCVTGARRAATGTPVSD